MSFDPATFMNTQFGNVSDKYIPFPADEYLGQVEKVDARSGTISKGERAGQAWTAMDVSFKPMGQQAEEAARAVDLAEIPLVRMGIMLNFDDQGKLLTGPNENVKLGKLLTALGLGDDWMPAQLVGQTCKITVSHRTDADTGEQYAEVKNCAPA